MPARKLKLDVREYIISTITLLTCNYTDFITGFFLTIFKPIISTARYLMLILPAIMNMRGCNYVTYSTRVSAKLHLGLIEPRIKRQTELSIEIAIVYTVTLAAGIIITLLAVLVYDKCLKLMSDILIISTLSGLISATATIPVTTLLLFQLFKKNIRPEVVVGPLESIVGDVITVPTLVLSYIIMILLSTVNILKICTIVLLLTALALLLGHVILSQRQRYLWNPRRVLLETITSATVSSAIEIFTGLFILNRLETYVTVSVLLFALPATMAAAGAINVKYSAELSTMLHLGELEPHIKINRKVLSTMSRSISQAFILYTNVILMSFVYLLLSHERYPWAILIPFLSGIATTITMLFITYYIVVVSFKLGINPANVSGPLIMPLCDLTSSLVYMMLSSLVIH